MLLGSMAAAKLETSPDSGAAAVFFLAGLEGSAAALGGLPLGFGADADLA